MITEERVLSVRGQEVDVVRKGIKNLHLSVYPPDGRVRVACPLHIDDEAVRLAVVRRLSWILRQQRAFLAQERVGEREYVSGESVYYAGKRYRLLVEEGPSTAVRVLSKRIVRLTVRPGTSPQARARAMDAWFREDLRGQVPALIDKWEPILGVKVQGWAIRRMERKWGTCDVKAHRIRLNAALARLSPQCLEYVVVHEMVHLLERTHGPRFQSLMDGFLPNWRVLKAQLSEVPLAP